MPTKGDTQINSFVGGIITEASPLSFPPNASIDESNMKLRRDGSRERRLGIDYEDTHTLNDTTLTAAQLQIARERYFNWPSPSGNTDVNIGIVQIGGLLFFMDMFTDNPSSNLLNGGSAYDTGLSGSAVINFALINNKVALVSGSLDTPFLLSYDKATDTVSAVTAQLKIRDLYGIDDALAANTRPTSLTVAHEYNLRNQGWDSAIVTKSGAGVLQDTFNALGKYPSNSDTWSLGKIADVTDADVDKFDGETFKRNSFDVGRAARGHFIIDLYNRGASRETESGLNIPNADRDLGRISTVESYAGRLFYAGVTSRVLGGDTLSPNLSGAVLYSQVARSDGDLIKCHQELDPTSPTNNDQLDTDGGVIQIAGAVDVVRLMAVKTSLFVFATNGIWQIRGDEGGFRSTSFQVNKISSVGVMSPESIVEANGTIFFWATSGIYSLTPNQIDSTTFDSTNISLQTIQRGYNTLPNIVKQNARGFYDINENTVRWLFRSDTADTLVVPSPDPEVIAVGEAVSVDASLEPKLVRISNTKAMIVYRNSGATTIDARILTVDPVTYETTVGAEQNLVTSTNLGGMSLTFLSANKVLLTYLQNTNMDSVVANISLDTITLASTTTINAAHQSSAYTSPIRSALVSAGKVLVGFNSNVNSMAALQIVEIDGSDNITFGTVATSTDTNLKRINFALLSTTAGVMMGDTTGNTRVVLMTFTISGTAVTIDATSDTFLTTTQLPPPTGFSNTDSFITPINSTSVAIVTKTTTSSPTVSGAMYQFTAAVSGSSVSSTTVLKQDLEIGTVPVMATSEGKTITVFRKASGGDFVGRVLVNTPGTTPTQDHQLDLGSDTTFAFPEMAVLNEGLMIIGYETATEIKAIAGRVL